MVNENGGTATNPVAQYLSQHNIQPVFMLFTASPIDPTVELAANECIADLTGMRSWQPTTAHAAETALWLRRILRPGQFDDED
jgi:hypothetical protein